MIYLRELRQIANELWVTLDENNLSRGKGFLKAWMQIQTIKKKKKNLNKAYFKILSNAMLFDCFYLALGGRPSPRALLLGIPGLGPEGVVGGAEESWLDSGPMEGLRPE